MILISLLFSLLTSSVFGKSSIKEIIENSSQLIITVGENENSFRARTHLYEKINGVWTPVKKDIPSVLGKNGMASGLGAMSFALKNIKKEGDKKTPAGVFDLGPLYGKYPKKFFHGQWPYTTVSKDWVGVDDSLSKHYNKILNKQLLKTSVDWKSHEELLRKDQVYNWFLEIKHNPENIPQKGSLIFFHVWENDSTGTAGCVAMDESILKEILNQLRPSSSPKMIILPSSLWIKISQELL